MRALYFISTILISLLLHSEVNLNTAGLYGGMGGGFTTGSAPYEMQVSNIILSVKMSGSQLDPEKFLDDLYSKNVFEQPNYGGFGFGVQSQPIGTNQIYLDERQKTELVERVLTEARLNSKTNPDLKSFVDRFEQKLIDTYDSGYDLSKSNAVKEAIDSNLLGSELVEKLSQAKISKETMSSVLHEIKFSGALDEYYKAAKFAIENGVLGQQFVQSSMSSELVSMMFKNGYDVNVDELIASGKFEVSEFAKFLGQHFDPKYMGSMFQNSICTNAIGLAATLDGAFEQGIPSNVMGTRQERITSSLNAFKSTLAFSKEIGVDVIETGKHCRGFSMDYLYEKMLEAGIDFSSPSLADWASHYMNLNIAKYDCISKVNQDVLNNNLCDRETLLSEAKEYLQSVDRVGRKVRHIYGHQIKNCILILIADITGDVKVGEESFDLSIDFVAPTYNAKSPSVDEIKNVKNYHVFINQLELRLKHQKESQNK